jgi:hypothetical protein
MTDETARIRRWFGIRGFRRFSQPSSEVDRLRWKRFWLAWTSAQCNRSDARTGAARPDASLPSALEMGRQSATGCKRLLPTQARSQGSKTAVSGAQ